MVLATVATSQSKLVTACDAPLLVDTAHKAANDQVVSLDTRDIHGNMTCTYVSYQRQNAYHVYGILQSGSNGYERFLSCGLPGDMLHARINGYEAKSWGWDGCVCIPIQPGKNC